MWWGRFRCCTLRRRRCGIAQGWSPEDPLTPISLGTLARQAGFTQFMTEWLPHLRDRIEATLSIVGAEKPFGRNAVAVNRADNSEPIAWTVPLDREQAVAVIGIARTAAITLLAALSGMRSSELMELKVGCCGPPEHYGPDLVRYRLAGRVIKGKQLGGVPDEWVVIEPAYRAAQLLEQLHEHPEPGAPLLGRFAFDVRCTWLRNWVNGAAGQRLGLAPIPDTPVNLRALRRTLAIELAYRPGGMLAAKWHLKHIAVATTEGYVSTPGGAQAELLAEVNKHEADRNLELVWTEFRNYQQGIMPAGPAARELTEFFAHVDSKLGDPAAPKTQASDREILNLLTKRTRTLHLGVANYCWFTDPSRALCLKLAGTPTADRPLAGMCDSARCPQATHHQHHRPVWAEHAEQNQNLPRQPRHHPPHRPSPPASRLRPSPARHRRHRRRRNRQREPGPGMRISAAQRIQNENRIRATMDRLLRGEIPPARQLRHHHPRRRGRRRPHRLLRQPALHTPTRRVRASARAAAARRSDPRPADCADRTAESRGRQAQNQLGPGQFDDRGTHRLPNSSPGPARRPTRRDPPAPHESTEGEHRPPPGDPTEGHRTMLTQYRAVTSVTGTSVLSLHHRLAASRTSRRETSSSNATRTRPHTVTAETSRSYATHLIEDGWDAKFVQVLSSLRNGVHDVQHAGTGSRDLRGGGGYLPVSITQTSRRFDACAAGADARFVA
jgi:hypothetical protein